MKFSRFRLKSKELFSILRHEYKYIFTDAGVLLIVVGAMFIYTIVYSLAYKPEVLRDVPVAIVDNSNTSSSRKLIRSFDASPDLNVIYNPTNLEEAKELFLARKINGIVVIPPDYEKKLMSDETVNISVYADASYFLIYRQVFFGITGSMMTSNAQVEWLRFVAKGAMSEQAQAMSNPVMATVHDMYNPYGGYATFILPAIIIVIIQQTLVLGIGMVGGTWRELGLYKKLLPTGERRLATIPLVAGRSLAYLSVYCVTLLYILGFHYKLFGYPMNGDRWDIVLFLIPYLLSCTFLGIAVASFFKHRENSLLLLLFTSIPCLMLSGASIPKEAMPDWLYTLGMILPSSSGVDGFIRIQTMGATLGEVSAHFIRLWILTGIYFVLACIGTRWAVTKSESD